MGISSGLIPLVAEERVARDVLHFLACLRFDDNSLVEDVITKGGHGQVEHKHLAVIIFSVGLNLELTARDYWRHG